MGTGEKGLGRSHQKGKDNLIEHGNNGAKQTPYQRQPVHAFRRLDAWPAKASDSGCRETCQTSAAAHSLAHQPSGMVPITQNATTQAGASKAMPAPHRGNDETQVYHRQHSMTTYHINKGGVQAWKKGAKRPQQNDYEHKLVVQEPKQEVGMKAKATS